MIERSMAERVFESVLCQVILTQAADCSEPAGPMTKLQLRQFQLKITLFIKTQFL